MLSSEAGMPNTPSSVTIGPLSGNLEFTVGGVFTKDIIGADIFEAEHDAANQRLTLRGQDATGADVEVIVNYGAPTAPDIRLTDVQISGEDVIFSFSDGTSFTRSFSSWFSGRQLLTFTRYVGVGASRSLPTVAQFGAANTSTSSAIDIPTYTSGGRHPWYAQPEGEDDPDHIFIGDSTGNTDINLIQSFEKLSGTRTVNGVNFEVWMARETWDSDGSQKQLTVFKDGADIIGGGGAATPLSDNTPEQTAGAGAAGMSDEASRSDHVHEDRGTGGGGTTPLSDSTPGQTAAAGAAGTSSDASRADHVHQDRGEPRELATQLPEQTGGTSAVGTSDRVAREDHRHQDRGTGGGGGGAALSDATPEQTAAAGSSGVAVDASRSDHVHEDRGEPLTLSDATPEQSTDTGAPGTAGTASRSDHRHQGGGGTTVVANPPGRGGSGLTRIAIDGTDFNVPAGLALYSGSTGSGTTYDEATNTISTTVGGGFLVDEGDAIVFQLPAALSTTNTNALTLAVSWGESSATHPLVNFDRTPVNATELVPGALLEAFRFRVLPGSMLGWVLIEPTDLTEAEATDDTNTRFGLVSGERLGQVTGELGFEVEAGTGNLLLKRDGTGSDSVHLTSGGGAYAYVDRDLSGDDFTSQIGEIRFGGADNSTEAGWYLAVQGGWTGNRFTIPADISQTNWIRIDNDLLPNVSGTPTHRLNNLLFRSPGPAIGDRILGIDPQLTDAQAFDDADTTYGSVTGAQLAAVVDQHQSPVHDIPRVATVPTVFQGDIVLLDHDYSEGTRSDARVTVGIGSQFSGWSNGTYYGRTGTTNKELAPLKYYRVITTGAQPTTYRLTQIASDNDDWLSSLDKLVWEDTEYDLGSVSTVGGHYVRPVVNGPEFSSPGTTRDFNLHFTDGGYFLNDGDVLHHRGEYIWNPELTPPSYELYAPWLGLPVQSRGVDQPNNMTQLSFEPPFLASEDGNNPGRYLLGLPQSSLAAYVEPFIDRGVLGLQAGTNIVITPVAGQAGNFQIAASGSISATDQFARDAAAAAQTTADAATVTADAAATQADFDARLPRLVPAGGDIGQILSKSSAVDYATQWIDAPSGGGGGGAVDRIIGGEGIITSPQTGIGTVTVQASWQSDDPADIGTRSPGVGTNTIPRRDHVHRIPPNHVTEDMLRITGGTPGHNDVLTYFNSAGSEYMYWSDAFQSEFQVNQTITGRIGTTLIDMQQVLPGNHNNSLGVRTSLARVDHRHGLGDIELHDIPGTPITTLDGDAQFLIEVPNTPTNDNAKITWTALQALLPAGGISQAQADVRYVNVSGDVMTGTLTMNAASGSHLEVERAPTSSQTAFQALNQGDTRAWFQINLNAGGTGKPGIQMGPGGTTNRDIHLYREGVNHLRTNDEFSASELSVTGSLATTQANLGITPVVANPTGADGNTLNRIQISGTNFNLPSGGGGSPFNLWNDVTEETTGYPQHDDRLVFGDATSPNDNYAMEFSRVTDGLFQGALEGRSAITQPAATDKLLMYDRSSSEARSVEWQYLLSEATASAGDATSHLHALLSDMEVNTGRLWTDSTSTTTVIGIHASTTEFTTVAQVDGLSYSTTINYSTGDLNTSIYRWRYARIPLQVTVDGVTYDTDWHDYRILTRETAAPHEYPHYYSAWESIGADSTYRYAKQRQRIYSNFTDTAQADLLRVVGTTYHGNIAAPDGDPQAGDIMYWSRGGLLYSSTLQEVLDLGGGGGGGGETTTLLAEVDRNYQNTTMQNIEDALGNAVVIPDSGRVRIYQEMTSGGRNGAITSVEIPCERLRARTVAAGTESAQTSANFLVGDVGQNRWVSIGTDDLNQLLMGVQQTGNAHLRVEHIA